MTEEKPEDCTCHFPHIVNRNLTGVCLKCGQLSTSDYYPDSNYETMLEQIERTIMEMQAEYHNRFGAPFTTGDVLSPSELAQKLLDWEAAYLKLTALEAEIKPTVLELAKTQTIGNVRATYSGGRRSYLYRDAATERNPSNMEELLCKHAQVTKKSWRLICQELQISKDDTLFTTSDPSVSIKLLG